MPELSNGADDEIEIDIDALDNATLRHLEVYVNSCLAPEHKTPLKKKKKKKKKSGGGSAPAAAQAAPAPVAPAPVPAPMAQSDSEESGESHLTPRPRATVYAAWPVTQRPYGVARVQLLLCFACAWRRLHQHHRSPPPVTTTTLPWQTQATRRTEEATPG